MKMKTNSEATKMKTKKALLLEVGEKIEDILADEFDCYEQVEVIFKFSNDGEIKVSAVGIERRLIDLDELEDD
jgi:hypothetical protein